MDIIGLYYCNITHAKIILTNQKRVVDYISKQNKNIVKYFKNINIIGWMLQLQFVASMEEIIADLNVN